MTMDSTRLRGVLALTAAFAIAACGKDSGQDGGGEEGDSSTGDSGSAATTMTTASATTENTTDPSCIPGSEDCPCLDGVECQGTLECIEDTCKPGPTFDTNDEDRMVLGGLVVPIQVDVIADEYSWSQVSGPTTEILGEGANIQVPVPADATPGEVITLRITAVRNTIEKTFDLSITVLEPVFEDFLVMTPPTVDELGTGSGIEFDGAGNLWVSSSEGFLSRFSVDGMFQSRYEVAGGPAGVREGNLFLPDQDDPIDVLYIAQTTNEAIVAYNPTNDETTTIASELEGGGALGAVGMVLPDGNGDVYFTNPMANQIIRYVADEGVARVLTEAVVAPTTLSFGPDANVLFVGAVGQVWRVGLLQDGTAGEPALYADVGDSMDPLQTVGGIAFDEGGNAWIGVPGANSAHIAPYVAEGATTISRSFSDVGAGISSFANIRFGDGDFDDTMIYWTNGSDRTIGRILTGLRRG